MSPFHDYEVGGRQCRDTTSTVSTSSPMRGYEDGALDPSSYYFVRGYNKITAELRYPIILKPSSQISTCWIPRGR
ncbi:MAG: hypothetical protein V8Q54_05690 [Alistipes senegalensis]